MQQKQHKKGPYLFDLYENVSINPNIIHPQKLELWFIRVLDLYKIRRNYESHRSHAHSKSEIVLNRELGHLSTAANWHS